MVYPKLGCIALATVVLLCGTAQAGVVYENAPPNQNGVNDATLWLQANVFRLDKDATVAGAVFWSFELPPASGGIPWDGTLEYFIFSDSSGLPATTVASGDGQSVSRALLGTTRGLTERRWLFNFESSVSLTANTLYWFGLHLATDYSRQFFLGWETGPVGLGNGSHAEAFQGLPANWNITGNEGAFRLRGVKVPEPGTVLLLALGGTALVLLHRRRRG